MTAVLCGAESVAAAAGDFEPGEAAFAVGCHARDRQDAALLLDILGVGGAVHRWDTARAARLTLSRCRHDRFTIEFARSLLPGRAAGLAVPAVSLLRRGGLAARAGTLPGQGRRVPAWTLTPAGCDLSDQLRGAPAAGAVTAPGWLLYDN